MYTDFPSTPQDQIDQTCQISAKTSASLNNHIVWVNWTNLGQDRLDTFANSKKHYDNKWGSRIYFIEA